MANRSPSPPPGRRRLLAALLGGAGLAAARPRPSLAQGAGAPAEVVERFHATLLQVMRDAARLGVQGRARVLRPAMEAAFDLPAMARIAVGPPWSGMTAEQQARIAQAFADWSVATYASRFDGYSGESFAMAGESTLRSGDRMVRTLLNRGGGEPVQLGYLLRPGASGWRIVDVYLTGSISELASRRAEFTTLLREGGPERLLGELDQRTARLLRG
ncbi:ABC transporter substrate-binding protein [Roseomonas sp. OT10]|uniref:ABC transporter substrate-binding protein n=1 Tax=Roseomonas cutis TaxID=2897332 RepID=UPI001E440C51|nr:ABC transporter substrate-binding protein [Roseomonas sp. OT10]UFN49672.1 ABC transporter substrate-binding protein [Roseomonas sp. OT10]